jgi:hypothetical protein
VTWVSRWDLAFGSRQTTGQGPTGGRLAAVPDRLPAAPPKPALRTLSASSMRWIEQGGV